MQHAFPRKPAASAVPLTRRGNRRLAPCRSLKRNDNREVIFTKALLEGGSSQLAFQLGSATFLFVDAVEQRTGIEPDDDAVQFLG